MQAPTPHPGSIQPGATSIRRQHGSMAIAMMLMLLGLISILGIVEVGYLYWAHRDAQKVADLAALSGAQQLSGPACTTDSDAYKAALGNAADNGATGKDGKPANGYTSIDITCGRQPANGSSILAPASASSVAAIKVVASRGVNPLFGKGMAWQSTFPIKAEAVAINSQPIASFSVGSSLAKIDPTLLNTTLGTSLGLQLLSHNGIANTNISLLGLVKASPIDVGTVSGVLNAPITVGDFLTAYVQALQQSSNAANIDMSIVNAGVASIEAQLGNTSIDLGSILNVNANTDDPNVALNTDVSALDILNAVVLAADSKNAVALPATSIDVPGVATVDLSLSIIEPPQIGIGGVGTTAHTAEIRLSLSVSVLNNPTMPENQSLLSIPLYLEIAPTDASIKSIQCHVPIDNGGIGNIVTIEADPGLLNAFLGKLNASSAFTNTQSDWATIVADGDFASLVNVSANVLGIVIPVAELQAKSDLSLKTYTPPAPSHPFTESPAQPLPQEWSTPANNIDLGTVIDGLLTSKTLHVQPKLLGISLSGLDSLLSGLLNGLSTLLRPILDPVFRSVDELLIHPLLQTLGISIDSADVRLISVNCNSGAQLVY
ncbi:pilus assembly protein TadG-related protein [Rhodanobacter glycinis]|uniref:Uncharacterized membrane protein n=1 Tax=Rhodanobacter glycinis TaxID=582702 RepID=A0A1I4DWP3_9GAMM|nr:pilus assembly protein TadG-related protein [Rhodanobacter glycinis]SFK98022.1 Uncharacterized membrane protein [Rhodanobacter glycinis]